MQKPVVLVADAFPEHFMSRLSELDAEVVDASEKGAAEVVSLLADATILIINSKIRLDARTLQNAHKLKLVCRAGVGMDHFDLPLLAEKGVSVKNTPGANAIPVGEQALGMLLALSHRIVKSNLEVKNFQWKREENRGLEITGKTVGIIGYGNTGSAFAKMLAGFGCRILAYDKYKTGFGDQLVEESSLDTLYAHAGILSIHVPLTSETRGWLDYDFFNRFRNPLYLLNLARGGILVQKDLIHLLEEGKILGAGLDVLENEKLNSYNLEEKSLFQKLAAFEQVVLTPHIGGWSFESLERINDQLLVDVKGFLNDL